MIFLKEKVLQNEKFETFHSENVENRKFQLCQNTSAPPPPPRHEMFVKIIMFLWKLLILTKQHFPKEQCADRKCLASSNGDISIAL